MKDNENEIKRAKKILAEFIKKKKLRRTAEREIILETVYSMPSFFDIRTLHQYVNEKMTLSLATIYNTLDLLEECNLIVCHNFNTKTLYYEKLSGNTNFYYKICTKCKSIKPFSDKKLDKSIALRGSKTFEHGNHMLYLYGICKKCRNNMQ